MSTTARHENRNARRLCQSCRDRNARFQYRGQVRADRDRTLCFECYRSERKRRRAHTLSAMDLPMLRRLFPPSPTLSERQIEHRLQMLAHLERSC